MNAPDPQLVLDLAAKLVRQRNELAATQSQWDALFGNTTSDPSGNPRKGKPRGRVAAGDSLSGRIVTHLEEHPEQHFDIAALTAEFDVNKTQIDRAVQKLFASGRIARHSRGNYAAVRQNVLQMDAA